MKKEQDEYIASRTQLRREWMELTRQEHHNYLVESRKIWEIDDLYLEGLQEATENVWLCEQRVTEAKEVCQAQYVSEELEHLTTVEKLIGAIEAGFRHDQKENPGNMDKALHRLAVNVIEMCMDRYELRSPSEESDQQSNQQCKRQRKH